MTNTEELNRAIDESGIKRKYIADALGISVQALRLKILNRTEFKQNEIATLRNILKLTQREADLIFFAAPVGKKETVKGG